MYTVLLLSLMTTADICSVLYVESVSDMNVMKNVVVGAGGVPRFPPHHSVDRYIRR